MTTEAATILEHVTIDQLKTWVFNYPGELNLDDWVVNEGGKTVFCLAGATLLLAGYPIIETIDGLAFAIELGVSVPETARRLLGLVDHKLFYEGCWPPELNCQIGGWREETVENRTKRIFKAINWFATGEGSIPHGEMPDGIYHRFHA